MSFPDDSWLCSTWFFFRLSFLSLKLEQIVSPSQPLNSLSNFPLPEKIKKWRSSYILQESLLLPQSEWHCIAFLLLSPKHTKWLENGLSCLWSADVCESYRTEKYQHYAALSLFRALLKENNKTAARNLSETLLNMATVFFPWMKVSWEHCKTSFALLLFWYTDGQMVLHTFIQSNAISTGAAIVKFWLC